MSSTSGPTVCRALAVHHGNWTNSKQNWPQIYCQQDRVYALVCVLVFIYRLSAALVPPPLCILCPSSLCSASPFFLSLDPRCFIQTFSFSLLHFSSIEVMKMLHMKILASHDFSNYIKLKPGKSGTWLWNSGLPALFSLFTLSRMQIWFKLWLDVIWDLLCLNCGGVGLHLSWDFIYLWLTF